MAGAAPALSLIHISGERLTLEELLYGLLLCSGNDAALALTECAGGVACLLYTSTGGLRGGEAAGGLYGYRYLRAVPLPDGL